MPQNTEKLMDITVSLADFTLSPELAARIPGYLSRTLNLEPLTLAVVRNADDKNGPKVILVASSSTLAEESSLVQYALDLHEKATPVQDTPPLRLAGVHATTSSTITIGDLDGYPHATIYTRMADDLHRVYLIVHQDDSAALAASQNILIHITNELGKLLGSLLAWQANPEILRAPFDQLTDREWIVLRGLNSEDGEKQLADRLGLSPHTLHSHIKSIYRKIDVQGRLPLLLRLNAAVRELRAVSLAPTVTEQPRRAPTRPVAYAM
ncbi:MAG: LuxR family transcriptional regulator [Phycisphaerales bacterium]|nr:LuxR family transcriptional regulator [Phycisphaerales bacterium]